MLRGLMIARLGLPICDQSLNEYLEFIENAKVTSMFVERHHILPRCLFPEHANDLWNLVSLDATDHKMAHLLLAKAYPINQFIYPLRWMHDSEESYAAYIELKRKAVKSWWINFKQSDQYDIWRKHRSECQTHYMANSINAVTIAEACNRKYTADEQRAYRSKGGSNPERAKAQSASLRKYYEDPVNREIKSEETKLRWANESAERRKAFSNKMDLINKSDDKRRKAGESIKNKWSDPEFKQRQAEGRKRHNDELKRNGVKRANSATMKEKWADPVWKAAELERRRLKKLEKLNETK